MKSAGAIALFGECMVELRLEAAGLWRQSYAGDVCNTAVYLARLLQGGDQQVQWVSAIGDDAFSAPMMAFWQSEGLETSLVSKQVGGSTGLYAIELDARGERQFSYWRSTSAARTYFAPFADQASPIEQAADSLQGLHFSGISLAILPNPDRQRLLNVAQKLLARGAWVSFDSNFRPRLWESAETADHWMRRALKACDHALVSMDDWQLLTGQQDERWVWQDLCAQTSQTLIIKRGSKDTWVRLDKDAMRCMPVAGIAHPVDTTAAGDAFAAGYLSALAQGLSVESRVMAGQALASEVIMHPGAIMPRASHSA
jgi:2-dehydro-3-deoxygluconokinase